MLPGKKYTPAEILQIALERKWLPVTFFVVGAAVAVAVSRHLPDLYRSESLIVATPQRISDNFVKQSVEPGLEERLPTIREQILSRAQLERMIDDFHLYSNLRRRQSLDDVVKRMRSDIEFKIEVDSTDRSSNHMLRISYVSPDARTAQQVVERLASLVIQQSARDRKNLAQDTNNFLGSQLEDAKARLIAHEKKLESYRRQYAGQLPTQAAANLQAIQNAQLQIQALSEAADRARERRMLVERQLADLQSDPLTELTLAPQPGTPDGPGQPTEVQLEAAKAHLRTLQLRGDKPNHPDIQIAQRTIRDLQAKLDAETKRAADGQDGQKPATPTEALRQRKIRELKGQRDDIDHELADKAAQEQHLRSVVAEYQAKLDGQPARESDLVELMRDYNTLQTTYQELLARREAAKIAENLEKNNIGEQFRVLEPARVPERPFSPNRLMINIGGPAGGLVLGLLLVAFLEYRDSGLKYEEDVKRLFNLPVLAIVPVLASRSEHKTAQRRRRVVAVATVALLAAVVAWTLWSAYPA